MAKLDLKDVTQYVELNIGTFHSKRIETLNKLKLKDLLNRKNPYLFKAKHMLTSGEIIEGFVTAHISSNEETLFGDWLEGLAIFINQKVYGGKKSSTPGIDLEFEHEKIRYLVNIKSGPNWGNSSQIEKMVADFKSAQRTLNTSGGKVYSIAVNGCCYGRDNNPDKGTYKKYCGQQFWQFISGEQNLYVDIIEPLGHMAKQKNEVFLQARANLINRLVSEFSKDYCKPDGSIDWEALVKFNSQSNSSLPSTSNDDGSTDLSTLSE